MYEMNYKSNQHETVFKIS